MHTLYPLLEETAGSSRVASSASKGGEDDVLSPELRDNFETMRTLIRQEKKRKADKTVEDIAGDEQLQAKKLQVAVKTAVAVEDEMSRLRNGIAELEALLAQQGNGEDHEAGMFPALPAIVPSDEGNAVEVEDDDQQHIDGKMVHG